ncbi:MarR family winged helix-turn-helix transcriptional regulator [Prescottella agglutinans]|uniref:DNA-binding MarR family transcriptional regulator n=1 Tax=Prescottella agglutinans TaxID=1644129 RepID=A0ABT6M7H0_9NOCA|nr:MarR family winged helix-turn-helix transcriptional regulator [Prescottella agglutinans]MDH6280260.1 DNA-binding MarR family transcriptional regulator [Prescottella agglutinans]
MDAAEEPRWLDDEENDAWIALESVLMRLPSALDAQLQRDAGMSHFEYQVLSGLSMVDDRTLRMSDLAAFAGGSLSRLSQVVGRLEKRGWVRRCPDPTDGRFTIATLTDDGWDVVVAAAPGHVEAVRRYVFDNLTRAQVRQLSTVGRRIVHAIDPGHPALVGLPKANTWA